MIARARIGLRALLTRFVKSRDGVAAVEFALILPFMLLLYCGSIELSDLINVDRRITVIASTVGDLVARQDGDIYNDDELVDYFNAAEEIITPYKTTGLKQLITCVKVNAAGTTATVQWSKGSGGATVKTGTITLPAAVLAISKDKYVIVSETQYPYKPLMGIVFKNSFTLYKQNFFLPRFGDNIVWKSGSRPTT